MPEGRTFSVQSENVLIRAGDCEVTVLPRFGGKIASIRVGAHELLQAPLAPIEARTQTMNFDEADASGWDECAPSVAACSVQTTAGTFDIPDHGDLWRVEWEKNGTRRQGAEGMGRAGSENSLALTGSCFSLPLDLERKMQLNESERGWLLELGYQIRNTGNEEVPWSWAAHPLFVCEEEDRIVLPQTVGSLQVEGSGGNRLGKSGDSVTWPVASLRMAVLQTSALSGAAIRELATSCLRVRSSRTKTGALSSAIPSACSFGYDSTLQQLLI